MYLYIGTYTEAPLGDAKGIYSFEFDKKTGELTPLEIVTDQVKNPSFLAANPSQRNLYAVCELDDGQIQAFDRDPATGTLTYRNQQSTHGGAPCYISIVASGHYALVANYQSGTVAALPTSADGALAPASSVIQHEGKGQNPDRQDGPHAHMIASSPDRRFVLSADLGTNQILVSLFDEGTGKLIPHSEVDAQPGAGPRHFAFAPGEGTLYCTNELASTVDVYTWDHDQGELTRRQTVRSIPDGFHDTNYPAHVVVSPNGRFVYASNRGHNSIAIFPVDQETGDLQTPTFVSTQGDWPRGFNLDPTGQWLVAANERSGNVVVFQRDAATGELTPTGAKLDIPAPVSVLFCRD